MEPSRHEEIREMPLFLDDDGSVAEIWLTKMTNQGFPSGHKEPLVRFIASPYAEVGDLGLLERSKGTGRESRGSAEEFIWGKWNTTQN